MDIEGSLAEAEFKEKVVETKVRDLSHAKED